MKTVLMWAECVFWPFNRAKLAIVGTVGASPIQEKIARNHEKSAPVCKMFVLGLKQGKIGYFGAVRETPIQENPFGFKMAAIMKKMKISKKASVRIQGFKK